MTDPRVEKLAHILVTYSIHAQKNENVLIECGEIGGADVTPLVNALIREIYKAGANPFVHLEDRRIQRELLRGASKEAIETRCRIEMAEMQEMDCYIGFSALRNQSAQCDVPQEKSDLFNKFCFKHVHLEQRLNHTRWVVLRYPTPAMAQLANKSEEEFEDFLFNVCTLDYAKMSRAMDSLKSLMEKTDKVRLFQKPTASCKGTDITFSIKGLPAIKCDGTMNIPDGEVYTAPVQGSINGRISYNTPSLENGFVFENISLLFKNGRIVEATANDTERINKIFDTDEGARAVGEFSFGINPFVLEPMKETLFDEKIAGSIHFTPGNAYTDCDNGNRSAIHWDLVLIMRPEYGGGEIYFDDKLIRKDGRFVVPELECLNPENLK